MLLAGECHNKLSPINSPVCTKYTAIFDTLSQNDYTMLELTLDKLWTSLGPAFMICEMVKCISPNVLPSTAKLPEVSATICLNVLRFRNPSKLKTWILYTLA